LLLLNDGSENVLGYVTAAIVVAGAIQVILGILKLGRLAEVFPSAVISGVLAAIGIIILINQLDDMLGFSYSSGAQTVLQKVSEIPHGLLNMNPLIAMIGVLGLVIMAFYPRVAKHGLRFIPAPIWVMIIGVLAVYFIGLDEPFSYSIGTSSFATGTDFLCRSPPIWRT
jgi:MFS superfamily sulfate permease-like transporter